jgi:chorismate mutase/prephenate dehydrogenase
MSASDLDKLRAELDALDRTLLDTVARRNAVVREIATAKAETSGGKPLFDRRREREVYERAEDIAGEVGVPPHVARALMEVIVEASHRIQEDASQRVAVAESAITGRGILIVGGHGRMGRLLGDALGARGHAIDVLEADDGRDRSEAVARADITIVAVPMEVAAAVTAELAPHVRPDALLCDINSLKEEVCAAMAACPGAALGLHPMFGPTVHALRRQKVVVCPVKDGELATWWRRELGQMGLELIESDPVAHDRMMAVVQVLVHFSTIVMGEALRRTGV